MEKSVKSNGREEEIKGNGVHLELSSGSIGDVNNI